MKAVGGGGGGREVWNMSETCLLWGRQNGTMLPCAVKNNIIFFVHQSQQKHFTPHSPPFPG